MIFPRPVSIIPPGGGPGSVCITGQSNFGVYADTHGNFFYIGLQVFLDGSGSQVTLYKSTDNFFTSSILGSGPSVAITSLQANQTYCLYSYFPTNGTGTTFTAVYGVLGGTLAIAQVDSSTGTWTVLTTAGPAISAPLATPCVVLSSGTTFVVYTCDGGTVSFYQYDSVANTWTGATQVGLTQPNGTAILGIALDTSDAVHTIRLAGSPSPSTTPGLLLYDEIAAGSILYSDVAVPTGASAGNYAGSGVQGYYDPTSNNIYFGIVVEDVPGPNNGNFYPLQGTLSLTASPTWTLLTPIPNSFPSGGSNFIGPFCALVLAASNLYLFAFNASLTTSVSENYIFSQVGGTPQVMFSALSVVGGDSLFLNMTPIFGSMTNLLLPVYSAANFTLRLPTTEFGVFFNNLFGSGVAYVIANSPGVNVGLSRSTGAVDYVRPLLRGSQGDDV